MRRDFVRIITSVGGLLRTLSASEMPSTKKSRSLFCELPAIDALLPPGGFCGGAIHEVLSSTQTPALLLPILMAKEAAKFGWVAWCDVSRQLYPPAVAAMGLPLDRLLVLRPDGGINDELWAMTECLGCRGISACVMPLGHVGRVQTRRLQLAAERGGGIGIALRPARALSWPYAAVTRWMVRPASGERMIQRCNVELIHGHGGRVGEAVLLEMSHETNHVRAIETVADRQDPAQTAAASA
jgi:hypothetical protein